MECCFYISGLREKTFYCFKTRLKQCTISESAAVPHSAIQLCAPPLQLKGILIGWGMSATSCITEYEPILRAAGWYISDVLNPRVEGRGCFQESGREYCEASVVDGSLLSLWVGHLLCSPRAVVLSCDWNSGSGFRRSAFYRSTTNEERGAFNCNLFMTQFSCL